MSKSTIIPLVVPSIRPDLDIKGTLRCCDFFNFSEVATSQSTLNIKARSSLRYRKQN